MRRILFARSCRRKDLDKQATIPEMAIYGHLRALSVTCQINLQYRPDNPRDQLPNRLQVSQQEEGLFGALYLM